MAQQEYETIPDRGSADGSLHVLRRTYASFLLSFLLKHRSHDTNFVIVIGFWLNSIFRVSLKVTIFDFVRTESVSINVWVTTEEDYTRIWCLKKYSLCVCLKFCVATRKTHKHSSMFPYVYHVFVRVSAHFSKIFHDAPCIFKSLFRKAHVSK